jgi:hypothetical protein
MCPKAKPWHDLTAGPNLNLSVSCPLIWMDEQWTETLRCPRCRKTGPASLTQGEQDETPRVNSLSAGFKVVYSQHGPNFRCEDCDVAFIGD